MQKSRRRTILGASALAVAGASLINGKSAQAIPPGAIPRAGWSIDQTGTRHWVSEQYYASPCMNVFYDASMSVLQDTMCLDVNQIYVGTYYIGDFMFNDVTFTLTGDMSFVGTGTGILN
ncbi:hypothetical protein [Gloeobacter morelensis]|uniref:hypothetical protein n=1 Tax=Gloeobacter morelensis TaxID=2907343 RepID=UPI001E5FAEC0|nr:hypothetical protein [Gloeobacter morelensis]UFP97245.1 hypothetical protein ISF26_24290 [Gloeobacter morelensis MG652769]